MENQLAQEPAAEMPPVGLETNPAAVTEQAESSGEEVQAHEPIEAPETAEQPEAEAAAETGDETPADAAPESTDEPPAVEPDSDVARKMEKLEARVGFLTRKLEKAGAPTAQQPEINVDDLNEPKLDDFETHEEYQAAMVDYRVDKKLAEHQATARTQQSEAGLQGFISDLVNQGREKYQDFAKVAEVQTVPLTQGMLEIMQDLDNPADVAYYLGKNLKECTAISTMSPVQAARALTKIEGKVAAALTAAPTPTKPRVTKAPAPINPVSGSHVVTKEPEKMTQAEYEAWRHGS